MRHRNSAGALALLAAAAHMPALAADAAAETADEQDKAFELGQIIVTAQRPQDIEIGSETLTAQAMAQFNRNSLDDAVNLMPGVSASNSGGSRNERLVFVRGFDRFQVPISIDGIRVYLPADNRLDYGRFLTSDVAEIQVAKGYASVLDGPGAMGGAINLVTRKPVKELEGEVRGTLDLDSDGGYAGYNAMALIGTRQDKWYAQASFTRNFRDHWDLAGGFTPTPTQGSGERLLSRTEDWRVNAKIGFTPNATDEYAISYTRQEGSKNAPLHITSPQAQAWAWPFWNIESIYFLSTTALADNATMKVRLYRNTFDNLLRGFDDATQTTQTLAVGRVFNSWYDDQAYGGSVQFDVRQGEGTRLSLAAHYRRDEHAEYQQTFGATGIIEPPQENVEDTYSIAAEAQFALTSELTALAGASYDWRDLRKAEEFGAVPGQPGNRIFSYPIRDANAWNAQGKLIWSPAEETQVHASLSSRARFPTVFERFSSRFGGATSNPDLKAERATNLEIGATKRLGPARLEASLFHSWLDDAIVAFPMVFNNTNVTQSRNVGKGKYYGVELAATVQASDTLSLGANYTWTRRDFDDPSKPTLEATGVPTHKAFMWADWSPIEGLHVLPNADVASDRWTVNTAGTLYYRTGSYVLANLTVNYELSDGIEIGVGARNLFDEYYLLTDGFPEQGRSFFATARARF